MGTKHESVIEISYSSRRCLMIMGMHRSGTSALTGVLSHLGLDLGKTMMRATEENPRGYFENQRVNDLNERLLSAMGSSWHDVFDLPEGWWREEPAVIFKSQIKGMIEEEFGEGPLFGIKDPRMCRLFPIWRESLKELDIELAAIIPVRHPVEAAESIRLRHGFSLQKGLLLWMVHTLSAEEFTRDIPRVWVSFEGLLRRTEKAVSRVTRGLDVLFPRNYADARDEIEAFLDPALKHFDQRGHGNRAEALPDLVRDWYRLLVAFCRGEGDDRKTLKAMDAIRKEFALLRAFFHHQEIRDGKGQSKAALPPQRQSATKAGEAAPIGTLAPSPPALASESWQWLREYREVASRARCAKKVRHRKKDFVSGPLTYHARISGATELGKESKSTPRPRILHAIANLRTGGSTRLVVDLFERLGHMYDQEVISSDIPETLHYDGFPFHDFSEPVTVEELKAFFEEKAPHIVHLHHWLDPWYEKVLEAASSMGATVIENVNTPFQILKRREVAKYVFVSLHARDSVSPAPENSTIIYPGSDGALFSRVEQPSEDTIGMVYRLEPDKLNEGSIRPLIDAVKRRPGTRVIIVGSGSLLSSFRRQVAEAELAGRFLFTGYVRYRDLPRWYAKFSVFAAPVWNESFGQVTPFAMASGIPVAGYRVGALPEILGAEESNSVSDCLVNTEEELTETIIRLLDDRSLRLSLGRELRARFERLFTLEAMIKAYADLYEELMPGISSTNQSVEAAVLP